MATSQSRQRHRSAEMLEKEPEQDATARPTTSPAMKTKTEEEVVWGKTPGGKGKHPTPLKLYTTCTVMF
jgi:hypothetical protein